jgi:hypothetical protein
MYTHRQILRIRVNISASGSLKGHVVPTGEIINEHRILVGIS